jgi:hypothetical protein
MAWGRSREDPIGAFETHLSYDFRPRLWVSLNGNFWYGGRTSLNGVKNPATLQESSRIGVTASFPLTRHQAIKVGLAEGAYARFGGDYRIASLAWQFSWMGKPYSGRQAQGASHYEGRPSGRPDATVTYAVVTSFPPLPRTSFLRPTTIAGERL